MSIKTTVLLVNNLLQNRLASVIAICRKQAAICLFLDAALKMVAYLSPASSTPTRHASTGRRFQE